MCYFQFQGAEIGPGMTADGIAVGGWGRGCSGRPRVNRFAELHSGSDEAMKKNEGTPMNPSKTSGLGGGTL